MRVEYDSLGSVSVPERAYWGAQTQRALGNFPLGQQSMPKEVIYALAMIKQAAAVVNCRRGKLSAEKSRAITLAAQEILLGKLDAHFPLSIWQSGSGTQTNMNVNEVVANRACQILGGSCGEYSLVHPNDDVNQGQSTNDSFSTAMHIAALKSSANLLDSLKHMEKQLGSKARQWMEIVKVGRTHLQDAVPVSLGQVFGGYQAQVGQAISSLLTARQALYAVAQGGTAVGTGLNTEKGFAEEIITELSIISELPLVPSTNKFADIAAHNRLTQLATALNAGASVLIKIANDLRFLASGPKAGLGELVLPSNEPGSSIMPGKVNPSQPEMLLMVCMRILGITHTVVLANGSGFFELNTAKPVMIGCILEALELLQQAVTSFTAKCLKGMRADQKRIKELFTGSLITVTALTPKIGYSRAAALAQKALASGKTIREVTLEEKVMSAEEFDLLQDPEQMLAPK